MNTSILPIEDNLKGKQLLCIPLDDREKKRNTKRYYYSKSWSNTRSSPQLNILREKKTSTITQDGHGRGAGKAPSRTIPNELATLK